MNPGSEPALCTMFVLRHAEKEAGLDPALTSSGLERADALARLLAGVQVDRMYCTEYLRTLQTLEPLSTQLNIPIEVIPAEDAPRWRGVIANIQAGEVVIICGHQNTVPLFIEEAGGHIAGLESHSGQPWIPGHIYDRLYLVTWQYHESTKADHSQTLELRYGTPCG